MTDPAPDDPAPRALSLAESIGRTANRLQEHYLTSNSEQMRARARAVLAELRRGAGTTPRRSPLIAAAVLVELQGSLDGSLCGRGDEFSPSEEAAFHALTLFALHMQSAERPMHVRGRSFGAAAGLLYRHEDSSRSIKPRFDALLSARDQNSRLVHARTLVTLMRARKIGFDYGRFATDLRALAGSHRTGVLLRWGRDFAFAPRDAAPIDSPAHHV